MSSSSSDLPDSADTTPSRSGQEKLSDAEAQVFETFAFDAGAGPAPQIDLPADLPVAPPADTRSVSHSESDSKEIAAKSEAVESETPEKKVTLKQRVEKEKPAATKQFAKAKAAATVVTKADGLDVLASTAEKPVKNEIAEHAPLTLDIHAEEAAAPSIVSRVVRQTPWWFASLVLHVLVLFILAFSTLSILQEEELELYASSAVYEPVEEFEDFEDFEIDPTQELDSLEEPLEPELEETIPELLTDLTPDSPQETPLLTPTLTPITSITPVPGESASADGLPGLPASTLPATAPAPTSTPSMARFFGTEIKARRILYILDNSGGMRRSGKFEALVSELMKSVRALSPKQEFYVVFYSDTVYPLFFPHSVRKFVRSNKRNQKQLAAWLDTVELCGGNAIDEALAAAEVIRPDAVFLLTDGDLFTTDEKEALLLNRNGRKYAIHTFGLGVGKTTKTAANLEKVAAANGGTFRVIKVSDEAKKIAKEKTRIYNKDGPGPIWGLRASSR